MFKKLNRKLIKSKQQIDGIRESGKVNSAVLDYITEKICIGMCTEDINRLIHDKTIAYGGYPATLGYEGFPKSVCTSINHEVCHGIPSDRMILKDGDIINVDVSTFYNGYYSDASRMFCLGNVSLEKRQLVKVAKEAVELGKQQVKPWSDLNEMSKVIYNFVKTYGYSVVEEIGGHGIGTEFHEEPHVSYVPCLSNSIIMVPGMVFTIEPMINMGKPEVIIDKVNGWTIYTKDGRDSAQWEVTVAVTETGCEILSH